MRTSSSMLEGGGEQAAQERNLALEREVAELKAELEGRESPVSGANATETERLYRGRFVAQARHAKRARELEGLRHQVEVTQRSNEAAASAQAWERSRGQAREAHQLARWMAGGVTPDLLAQVRRVLREAQAEAAQLKYRETVAQQVLAKQYVDLPAAAVGDDAGRHKREVARLKHDVERAQAAGEVMGLLMTLEAAQERIDALNSLAASLGIVGSE